MTSTTALTRPLIFDDWGAVCSDCGSIWITNDGLCSLCLRGHPVRNYVTNHRQGKTGWWYRQTTALQRRLIKKLWRRQKRREEKEHEVE